MALSPSREPAVWAGVGMTCGFIRQVFNNLLLVTSVSSGSASSHANFWEPTPWKVKNKRECVTPARTILSFQLSLNFGWDVFAWEGCWLGTKVGRSKKVGYEERSVPACLMSSWRQLLQLQSCVTTPSRAPPPPAHAHAPTQQYGVFWKFRGGGGMTQSLRCLPISYQIFHFSTLHFILTYVSACASVWVAATYMQITVESGVRLTWK